MRQRLILACMVLLVPSVLRADPVTIVNTGPGPATDVGYGVYGLQWLAVEFDVARPATITTVEGWMNVWTEGVLQLSLYSDGGEVPGDLLFQSTGFTTVGSAAWRGLTSLDWTVARGTYWVGFERQTPFVGTMPFPSENPLRNSASVDFESGTTYTESAGVAEIGVRIFGDPAPVPEPASLLLFGTGVVGLCARRQRVRALFREVLRQK